MKVKWAKSDQHTEFGLFRVGHIIDMAALGVPDEAVSSWVRDGYAVEVKPERESKTESRPAKKKASR
jgi:hypothetical protein